MSFWQHNNRFLVTFFFSAFLTKISFVYKSTGKVLIERSTLSSRDEIARVLESDKLICTIRTFAKATFGLKRTKISRCRRKKLLQVHEWNKYKRFARGFFPLCLTARKYVL